MRYDAFIGGSYESQALTADCERTVNWYPEILEAQGATAQRVLYPTPGVFLLSNQTIHGPGRAHYYQDGREFVIIGPQLLEVDSTGDPTVRGYVTYDSNPATIDGNGDGGGQLFITSGGNGYCYDLATNTLTAVAALDGKAHMGAFLDGYFLALDNTSSSLYLSSLFDGATWDPTVNFAQRSLAGDPWIGLRVVGRYIVLFGEQTSEIWYNAGTAPFPLMPVAQGLIQYGIAAPYSARVVGHDLVWLARSAAGRLSVMRMTDSQPETISTRPLETAIMSYRNRTRATADVYSDRGHTFYMLHFDDDITWSWDVDTKIWSERGTWIDGKYIALRSRQHCDAFNETRLLDYEAGGIYRMDPNSSDDVYTYRIRRMRRAPAIENENQRIYYASFELDLEPGLDNTTTWRGVLPTTGSDPQVMLRVSNDGGKTWGPEQMRSAGKLGEYGKRVRWNRMGSGRRRVFEVSVTDQIPWRITGAYMTLGQPVQQGG